MLAVNPLTKESVPVYLGAYVLKEVGQGAVMSVPAHDQRDFDFAKQFNLNIRQVIMPYFKDEDNIEYFIDRFSPYYVNQPDSVMDLEAYREAQIKFKQEHGGKSMPYVEERPVQVRKVVYGEAQYKLAKAVPINESNFSKAYTGEG